MFILKKSVTLFEKVPKVLFYFRMFEEDVSACINLCWKKTRRWYHSWISSTKGTFIFYNKKMYDAIWFSNF